MKEYKIHNADVVLNEDSTVDELIDVIEGNRVYIPAIYVLNKIDQISIEELDVIYKIPHCVPISAHHKVGKTLDSLKNWTRVDSPKNPIEVNPPKIRDRNFILVEF